jgi:hypothetical protein
MARRHLQDAAYCYIVLPIFEQFRALVLPARAPFFREAAPFDSFLECPHDLRNSISENSRPKLVRRDLTVLAHFPDRPRTDPQYFAKFLAVNERLN